jgi:hypothetical protein
MEITYKNFDKGHIPDNEAHYFDLIQSIIENVDKHSIFVITKNPRSYTFRLSTSISIVNPIVKQINIINTAYGLSDVEFSKSMKSGNLFWAIQI